MRQRRVPPAAPSPSGTSAAGTTSAPGATATGVPADDADPVDGASFCAFLTEEAPKLKAAGSTAGAEAELAIDLAGWIEEHPERKPRTGADLDAASEPTCPKVRASVVASVGAGSFQESPG
ncbi:hypothetical protein [Actinacidiphila sp. ITFR-21]|uniref:hypothetical protein n=1 Tax=Actinacidiphila sp. ITFR-21 TaxID=3075199 RepID=UPI002889DEB6|nr:hypothetical protein [Streptomyces sp. ITFR-21]WNI14555.1 hypothetical protein RLT57_02710 [Streptomyces sp. ITFR-21]